MTDRCESTHPTGAQCTELAGHLSFHAHAGLNQSLVWAANTPASLRHVYDEPARLTLGLSNQESA